MKKRNLDTEEPLTNGFALQYQVTGIGDKGRVRIRPTGVQVPGGVVVFPTQLLAAQLLKLSAFLTVVY
nr:unnamed protein product [Spirometra erinaceieuropaei]